MNTDVETFVQLWWEASHPLPWVSSSISFMVLCSCEHSFMQHSMQDKQVKLWKCGAGEGKSTTTVGLCQALGECD